MPEFSWYKAADIIRPHVVRISTPRGAGTGFLLVHGKRKSLSAIATAAHVIDQAHYWEEPIRIQHAESGKSALIHTDNRALFLHEDDTAAIVVLKDLLPLPDTSLPLIAKGFNLKLGIEIAWVGFPAITGADLCFFGGRVSAWLKSQSAYLVDGVAISGVSGGPAFYIPEKTENQIIIMGVVSAYAPNRVTGEALPGLSVVRGVSELYGVIEKLDTFGQAKEQETPPASVSPSTSPSAEAKPSSGKIAGGTNQSSSATRGKLG